MTSNKTYKWQHEFTGKCKYLVAKRRRYKSVQTAETDKIHKADVLRLVSESTGYNDNYKKAFLLKSTSHIGIFPD